MDQELIHIETDNVIPEDKEPNAQGMEYGELYEVVQKSKDAPQMFIRRR